MFKRPVKGKKAKTISCKNAHLNKNIIELSYKKPYIKKVCSAEIMEKTSYMRVMDAYIEGASVERKQIGTVNDDITLNSLFDRQGEKK